MAKRDDNFEPRIENRRAYHDYTIEGKLECGISLLGSEVKSLRLGRCQISDAFARIERGQLILYQAHIDPYEKASGTTHEPKRPRVLLAHKREIKRLAGEIGETQGLAKVKPKPSAKGAGGGGKAGKKKGSAGKGKGGGGSGTLVPLAIYFKDGRAKVEIGVARGRQSHDKRDAIKKKEMDRELRKMTTTRQPRH